MKYVVTVNGKNLRLKLKKLEEQENHYLVNLLKEQKEERQLRQNQL